MPEIINFEGGKFYFGSWLQSMVSRPCCFGPLMAPYITMRVYGGESLFASGKPGYEEKGRG
jgi:hypothetical protein